MARRQIGTGTTDSTGKITVSYTGTGAGKLQLVAVQGNITSETYTLEDCYFIETGSPTSGYNPSNGTLTVTDGVFSFTRGSSGTTGSIYTNFPKTNYPIEDFQNKTLTVKADILQLTVTSLKLSLIYNNGSSWSTAVTETVTSTGVIEKELSVPSYATQVRIRFDVTGNENEVAVFRDFRLLL